MKLKTLIASTMLAGALIGCGGGSTGGNEGVEYTPYPDAPEISASEKQAFLDAVNEEREKGRYCGDVWYPAVPALRWDDHLYTAAYERARDIVETGHNTHDHSGSGTEFDWTAQVLDLGRGSTVQERAANNGYVPPTRGWGAGENAASGSYELEDVMDRFWQSAPHCANFMDGRDMSILGFAHYYREDVDQYWKNGWVAVFAGE